VYVGWLDDINNKYFATRARVDSVCVVSKRSRIRTTIWDRSDCSIWLYISSTNTSNARPAPSESPHLSAILQAPSKIARASVKRLSLQKSRPRVVSASANNASSSFTSKHVTALCDAESA